VDPEFDICAWALGDAKAERSSDYVLAARRSQASEARGFLKEAISEEDQAARDRTIGSALGSGVSNFVTGYAISPILVRAYGGNESQALKLKRLRARPARHLKKIYGPSALAAGAVLSGASLVGGGIREWVQSNYESKERKRRGEKADPALIAGLKEASEAMSGVSGSLSRVTGSITKPKRVDRDSDVERRRSKTANGDMLAYYQDLRRRAEAGDEKAKKALDRREKRAAFGIMAYTRDPAEAPTSSRPERASGRSAQMFGGRLDGKLSLHKKTERKGEEWHAANSEFVEIGERPGLAQALGEIMGLEPGTVLSRREVSKAIGEKDTVRSRSREYRRKAKDRPATQVPGDVQEVVKAISLLLENPEARFFEVVES